MKVRAPGKLMLAGEYAVLRGRPSLVMAVDRYAVASGRADGDDARVFPEIAAAFEAARDEGLCDVDPAEVRVDVRALQGEGSRKLGLGSSAAACVAALGWACATLGPRARRRDARRASALAARSGHRKAQGGGSGVDVIASALGGVVRVQPRRRPRRAPEMERHPGMGAIPWAVLVDGHARAHERHDRAGRGRIERATAKGFAASLARIAEATDAMEHALACGRRASAGRRRCARTTGARWRRSATRRAPPS